MIEKIQFRPKKWQLILDFLSKRLKRHIFMVCVEGGGYRKKKMQFFLDDTV